MKKRLYWHSNILILILFTTSANAQDSCILKVHFLYGSKPKKEFRETESKWFGGILGGHVGIEVEKDKILNFVPAGKFHVFHNEKDRHSAFVIHSTNGFYSLFGGKEKNMKRSIVHIPISHTQKMKFDSISKSYQSKTPYDYAFIGNRCGSAAYDILSQLDVLPRYGYRKNFRLIFYPRRLRKRLLKKAEVNTWTVTKKDGSPTRKWERD